tara:strand:- start:24350 stop:24994 length:645 start_codon:yes stop_codon:yes gene_type:complete
MKKLICFSLWGDKPLYTIGAIKNAELAEKHYPGWICRYYIGSNTPNDIISKLENFNNTEIIKMGEGDWTGMFWRFYPASEDNVEIMLSRDTDSRLNSREAAAVNEWIESDKGFHIMRDHPYHTTQILGGMWGTKKSIIHNMKELIDDYVKGDFWQVDQNFLREKVYPLIKDDYLSHDEYFEKNSFPTIRKPGLFIGQAFDENDNKLHPEHGLML